MVVSIAEIPVLTCRVRITLSALAGGAALGFDVAGI
jgi:hypothetical protein